MENQTNSSLPITYGKDTQSVLELSTVKALDVLAGLRIKELRKNCPRVPEHAIPRKIYSDKTSNGLTRCIVEYVYFMGGQAERISSEGRVIDTRKSYTNVFGQAKTIGSIKRIKTSGQRGTADISMTYKGLSIKVEVKVGRDRQSEVQKAYQKSIEKAGGIYYVANDFQAFFDWFNKTFLSDEK